MLAAINYSRTPYVHSYASRTPAMWQGLATHAPSYQFTRYAWVRLLRGGQALQRAAKGTAQHVLNPANSTALYSV